MSPPDLNPFDDVSNPAIAITNSECHHRCKILDNILQCVGDTPLVRINKLGLQYGVNCEILAKCEFFNAGGSIKDRIAKRMVEDAESQGLLSPNYSTLVEPTSGNTGIGLAMAATLKGYHCTICMPEKMSREKVDTMRALGAKIIRTPTELPSNHPNSHLSIAKQLVKEGKTNDERVRKGQSNEECIRKGQGNDNQVTNHAKTSTLPASFFMPDQYTNPNNPLAHYEGTGREIWNACQGKLDVIVMGAGTGGTISGVGKYLKERNPSILIIGVDPVGSVLSSSINSTSSKDDKPYLVEGIGYDFIPNVLDNQVVDRWIKVNDRDCFRMARQIIRHEALLCGGSSGGAMWAALQVAKELNLSPTHRMVVLLPDSLRNYMSKFLSDDWMLIHDFITREEWEQYEIELSTLLPLEMTPRSTIPSTTRVKLSSILSLSNRPPSRVPIVKIDMPASILIDLVKDYSIIAVKDLNEKIMGYVQSSTFASQCLRQGCATILQQTVRRQMKMEFKIITSQDNYSLKQIMAYVATGYPVFMEDPTSNGDFIIWIQPQDLLIKDENFNNDVIISESKV